MLDRENCGQEAIEFILISVLVFFGAVFTITVLGDKLTSFFTEGSSVSNVATKTVATIDANSGTEFQPDYETSVDIPRPVFSETISSEVAGGLEEIDVNGVKIQVPTNISTVIQTTGASGGTDQIAGAIKALVAQMQAIADENPGDPILQNMVTVAGKIADKGYLVSDTEEWYEVAAQRLTSDHSIDLPEDNRICEFGIYVGSPACDHTVTSQDFLYLPTGSASLSTNLNREVAVFTAYMTELKALDHSVPDERINTIVKSIDMLSDEIVEISDNVKLQAADVNSLDDLNSGVASQTTDIKAALIEYYKEKMAEEQATKAASESTEDNNATNDPLAGSSNVDSATTE